MYTYIRICIYISLENFAGDFPLPLACKLRNY